MLERFAARLVQARFTVWVVITLLAVVLWQTTPPVVFDQTIDGFFPVDHPALASYQRSKQVFGGDQLVFVAYDDAELWTEAGMDRVRALAEAISERVPGVARVDAIDDMPVPWMVDSAIAARASNSFSLGNLMRMIAGRTTVRSLVRSAADDPELASQIQSRISRHPLFRGMFVDASGKSTAILVRIQDAAEIDQKGTIIALRQVADEFAKENEISHVAVAGPPVLVVDGFISLDKDNRTVALVAMAIIALTMLMATRNPVWAVLPLFAGWMTWQLTAAFLVWFDLRLALSSGPIVAQTVVLCMPAASHLAVHFFEARTHFADADEAARQTLMAVFRPVAMCALTAAAGYLAMSLVTTVRPVAQFGLTMCFCNLAAGVLAVVLAPGAMRLSWRGQDASKSSSVGMAQHVGSLTAGVLRQPIRTLIMLIVPTLLISGGLAKLEFESNYINVYKPHARVARDYRFLEERMGGLGLLELVFPGPEQITPEWLAEVAAVGEALHNTDPELITSVVTLAHILGPAEARPAEQVDADESDRNDSDRAAPQEIIDTKIRMLGSSSRSYFLDNLWNQTSNTTRILVRVRETAPADRKNRCFAAMVAVMRARLSNETYLTGLSHLMTQITDAVISTAFESTLWSAAMILMMLWLALRSVRLALLALAPTLLAVALVLGVMGWFGVKIDMSTALVASVAIGLSVDDTFHCLLRWQRERKTGKSNIEALHAAYAGTGPGVVLSSAAVSLGFLAMTFSEFVPTSNFGWLVAVATLGGSLGNLVLLPAMLVSTETRVKN